MVLPLEILAWVLEFHTVPVWGLCFLLSTTEAHLPGVHCFADDSQLYLSFKPGDAKTQDEAVESMENCIRDLRTRMLQDKLKINDDETEFIIIGFKQ